MGIATNSLAALGMPSYQLAFRTHRLQDQLSLAGVAATSQPRFRPLWITCGKSLFLFLISHWARARLGSVIRFNCRIVEVRYAREH